MYTWVKIVSSVLECYIMCYNDVRYAVILDLDCMCVKNQVYLGL